MKTVVNSFTCYATRHTDWCF